MSKFLNTTGYGTNLKLPASSQSTATVAAAQSATSTTIVPSLPGIQISTSPSSTSTSQSHVYVTNSKVLKFTVTGLKPLTQHNWILAGKTGKFVTSTTGTATIKVPFKPGVGTATNLSSTQSLVNGVVGSQVLKISNRDGTSTAAHNIVVAPGNSTNKINPVAPIVPVHRATRYTTSK